MNINNIYIPENCLGSQLQLFGPRPSNRRGRKKGQQVAQYISSTSLRFVLNSNEENNISPSPERFLLAAILVNAIRDVIPKYLSNGETIRNDRYSAEDAYLWFRSNGLDAEGKLEAFSFVWICEQLGIDGKLIRANAMKCYEQR